MATPCDTPSRVERVEREGSTPGTPARVERERSENDRLCAEVARLSKQLETERCVRLQLAPSIPLLESIPRALMLANDRLHEGATVPPTNHNVASTVAPSCSFPYPKIGWSTTTVCRIVSPPRSPPPPSPLREDHDKLVDDISLVASRYRSVKVPPSPARPTQNAHKPSQNTHKR